jgi:hypothetical protein
MKFGFLLLSFLNCTSALAASESELQSCRAILANLDRLGCFDKLVPLATGENTDNADVVKMSVVDFLTDYKELQGKKISVSGFGLVMGQMTLLYQARGQFSAITVETDKLGREGRRSLLSNCGSGCDLSVIGTATDQFGQAALSAVSVGIE